MFTYFRVVDNSITIVRILITTEMKYVVMECRLLLQVLSKNKTQKCKLKFYNPFQTHCAIVLFNFKLNTYIHIYCDDFPRILFQYFSN